jgi:hypothetical protein
MSRPLATGAGLIGTLAFPNSITLTPPAASVEIGSKRTATDLPVTVAMTAPSRRSRRRRPSRRSHAALDPHACR